MKITRPLSPVRASRAALIALVLGLASAGALLVLRSPEAQQPPAPAAVVAIPVTTAISTKQDVPVLLHGLGTVQAFNDVTVKARVDGTLMEVKVTEGQEIKKGDLVAVIDPRPYQAALESAQAKKAQDEAQLTNARLDLNRYASLATKDFASRQQVDTQQAMVSQLTAALKGDDAAINTAQLNLSFCFITSPIDGRAGLRLIDPGNLIHATDAGGIITITQIRPISVVFTLPQDDLPQIADAMAKGPLPVQVNTGNDRTELAQGTLLTPNNAIDTSTGTIKLKATSDNEKGRLWPGQFVNARLMTDMRHDVLTIPSDAIQHGPSGLYAYVVRPDSTVIRRDIEIDQDTGTIAVVTKGLSGGDKVVVTGQSRLQNGTRVAETPQAQSGKAGS